MIADKELSRGKVDQAATYPYEICNHALELSAARLILVYNHPVGDPEPGWQNRTTTQ